MGAMKTISWLLSVWFAFISLVFNLFCNLGKLHLTRLPELSIKAVPTAAAVQYICSISTVGIYSSALTVLVSRCRDALSILI